nr:hypothetical protein [Tanacetum cinerariifolium]
TAVWKHVEDFIPMGSKEKAERLKRKGFNLEQEHVELKRLYEQDPEDQLWNQTQNFMHAPVEWKLYDLCGVHQVAVKYKDIFMLVEKEYPLRKGLAIMMISYKLQVETYSRMANELVLKIYKIASTPRQQGD